MKVIEITKENYQKEIENAEGKIIIDFYADWCMPCKRMSPIVDQIAEENPDVKFVKVNIDENEDLARTYGIMSIPTFVYMEDGAVVSKKIGMMPKEELMNLIKK